MGLTKKRRKEIYLNIYKKLEDNTWKYWGNNAIQGNVPYICDMLQYATNRNYYCEDFPEFCLFEPKNKNRLNWWKIKDIDSRKNALLLAAEMCND